IERHFTASAHVAQEPGGRLRVGVADKKYRVLRILDDSACKNVRECLWNHHPAGEDIHTSAAHGRIAHGFIIENEWRYLSHELQPRQLPPRRVRAPVVDIGELRAETADINWKLGQQPLPSKPVEHRQNLLCLA